MAEKSRGSQHGARKKLSSGPRDKTTVNEHMKEFEEGQKVQIQINPQVPEGRPHQRFHGRTVRVSGRRGDAYEVKFDDGDIEKTLYIKPVHLEEVE